MPFSGHDPTNRRPPPFYHPQPQPHRGREGSWRINQLTQEHYGTDVPTLWQEIDRLEHKLKRRGDDLKSRERDLDDLRHRHRKLKSSYDAAVDLYERAVEMLRDHKERTRWRSRRLY